MNRYLIISYVAKGGNLEFSAIHGYKLAVGEQMPSYNKIRSDCLEWANRDGDNFNYFHLANMQFVDKDDYMSFMELN